MLWHLQQDMQFRVGYFTAWPVAAELFGAMRPGAAESVHTINALLTEMDGFEDNTGVVVMAATNRPEALDGALIRAGRFDRTIEMPMPDVEVRGRAFARHSALATCLLQTGAWKSGAGVCHCWLVCGSLPAPRVVRQVELVVVSRVLTAVRYVDHLNSAGKELMSPMPVQW